MAEAPARGDDVRPLAPGEVFARRDVDGSVVLAWRPGGDDVAVAGYNVYRNGTYHDTVHALGYRDADAPADDATFYEVVAFDAVPNFSRLSAAVLVSPLGAADETVETLDVTGADASSDGRTRVSLDGDGVLIVVAGETVTALFADAIRTPVVELDLADGEAFDLIVPAGSVIEEGADFRVRFAPDAVSALGSDIRIVVGPAADASGVAVDVAPR